MIFKPHQFQSESIEFLKQNKCAGLFADPGLGKTSTVLHLIDQLYFESKKSPRVLIVAPLRVIYSVWPAEIKKWDQFKYFDYTILHGKDREKNLYKKVDIYLINAENIFWLLELPESTLFDMLVIDESSKFKSHKSKRFKALRKNLIYFKRRIILTGTPAPQSLMDLYTQIFILDRGEALGKKVTHFKERYFSHSGYRGFHEWTIKEGAEDSIHKAIAPKVLRIEASDYLDLPDLIYNDVIVKLPKKTMETYTQMETLLFAELDGEELTVPTKSSAYNSCHQIANGAIYRPTQLLENIVPTSKRKVILLHKKKIEALTELISELQGKSVLIAYHFKHDLKALIEVFGKNTPHIGSGVNPKDGMKHIDDWNKGKLPVLLGHPQSMSHGLNLQSGGLDIIWFSLTDDLENYIQFNRRIYRQGVKKAVRVHHIIAEDTVDVAILARTRSKDKKQKSLLDALKEYRNGKIQ